MILRNQFFEVRDLWYLVQEHTLGSCMVLFVGDPRLKGAVSSGRCSYVVTSNPTRRLAGGWLSTVGDNEFQPLSGLGGYVAERRD